MKNKIDCSKCEHYIYRENGELMTSYERCNHPKNISLSYNGNLLYKKEPSKRNKNLNCSLFEEEEQQLPLFMILIIIFVIYVLISNFAWINAIKHG